MKHYVVQNEALSITVGEAGDDLWRYTVRESGFTFGVGFPSVEIDGKRREGRLSLQSHSQREVREGLIEHRITGHVSDVPGVTLTLVLRLAAGSTIVRARYEWEGAGLLTKTAGKDELTLLNVGASDDDVVAEVRLSDFDTLVHSYRSSEAPIALSPAGRPALAVGPIVTLQREGHCITVAYEHGAQAPDSFLEFVRVPGSVSLNATKGSYLDRQPMPYATVWFEVGAVAGDEDAAAQEFRTFILHHQSEWQAAREPWVFYNTWAMQERAKWWRGGKYLDPMNQEAILSEIAVAGEIGVDVFVLDTGWYRKTGDWEVDPDRFTGSLTAVRESLEATGMRLGLWFGPTNAAVSSTIVTSRPELRMSWRSVQRDPEEIWETEESVFMCLVSDYADYFADQLIRLHEETGVTYFKWDAVGQYGCDDPGHNHGDASHSPDERADSYAYQLPLALTSIASRVCAAVPDAIVDFDVTESGRSVGLSFLSAGKYFLLNNGPYTSSFDMPELVGMSTNLLFYPGPARARNARVTLEYDRWIPSTLFLVHYLPDDAEPRDQVTNIASLMLGHGGIWGELSVLGDAGRARIRDITGQYSVVRDAMRSAVPVRAGRVGGSPEVHEKVSDGAGAVIAFSPFAQQSRYVTRNPVGRDVWHTDGASVAFLDDGRAAIDFQFVADGAIIVRFTN